MEKPPPARSRRSPQSAVFFFFPTLLPNFFKFGLDVTSTQSREWNYLYLGAPALRADRDEVPEFSQFPVRALVLGGQLGTSDGTLWKGVGVVAVGICLEALAAPGYFPGLPGG